MTKISFSKPKKGIAADQYRYLIGARKVFNNKNYAIYGTYIGEWYVVMRNRLVNKQCKPYPLFAYHKNMGWICPKPFADKLERWYYLKCIPFDRTLNESVDIAICPRKEVFDFLQLDHADRKNGG